MISIRAARRHREEKEAVARKQSEAPNSANAVRSSRPGLASVMMEEAGCGIESKMKAVGSMRKVMPQDDVNLVDSDSDEPPPIA